MADVTLHAGRITNPERQWARALLGRGLAPFAALRPGEGGAVALFFCHALLLLVCYYILKTLREPLLLANGSAASKSYAAAATALVLLALMPLYGAVFRRADKCQLIRWITVFFVATLALFWSLGRAGVDIGFAYYLWLGVFSLAMLAQFWAHAAHALSVDSGERLFPVIMAGAVAGGLLGPPVAKTLMPTLGTWGLMIVAIVLLGATVPLVARAYAAVPSASRGVERPTEPVSRNVLNGFALIVRDPYLRLMALLIVLLNCVNTTGEYLIADLVVRHAEAQVDAGAASSKSEAIAAFYGSYYFAVNALAVVLQLLLVGRLFGRIGVRGAIRVLPAVALLGYGLIVFVPIFGVIAAVKVLENGVDYSIMNTARHALYLPLSAAAKYEGKTAVDTFVWRFGDVLQGGLIFVGLNWLGFGFRDFAIMNLVLALAWLAAALRMGAFYEARRASVTVLRRDEPLKPLPRRLAARRPVSAGVAIVAAGVAATLLLADAEGAPQADGTGRVAALEPSATAEYSPLFADRAPLALELTMDMKAFCRNPERKGCADTPATLRYVTAAGAVRDIDVHVRARGRWRRDTGACVLPALFVTFGPATAAGTPFEGQHVLALTTHCKNHDVYEQNVLKEYFAYRAYNALTEKSLRVRLARITYRDGSGRARSIERHAFFTEHFDALAARQGMVVVKAGKVVPQRLEPLALATLELFQYMIGNTDWSVIYGHNVLHLRAPDGVSTAVPYDFDFSGLVDAPYAGPSPMLPIRSVRQRLYRGFCRPALDWDALFAHFERQRDRIEAVAAELPALAEPYLEEAEAYVDEFFAILDSPERRRRQIVEACRANGA